MRPEIIIFWCLIWVSNAYSQDITGTVAGPDGLPLPGAPVSVIDTIAQNIIVFTTSDQAGRFRIRIPDGKGREHYALRAMIMGYKKEIMPLQSNSFTYNFKLEEDLIALPEIVVKNRRPVLDVNGDTTSYRVSEFSSPHDRVIGDVLKKMPGIEVDSKGKISFNGKSISSFNIEGDDLLGAKYNIATNSVPNAIVDKVQVIEHYEPVKMFRKTSVSENVALNITIKDGAARKPINRLIAGAGLPDLYEGDLTNMLFPKQFKAINQLKINNTGTDFKNDLIPLFTADRGISGNTQPVESLLSIAGAGSPDFSKNRYFFNVSGIINTNNLYRIKDDVLVKTNISYLNEREVQRYASETRISLDKDTIAYNEQLRNTIRPSLLSAEITYKVNKETHFLNNALKLEHHHTRDAALLLTHSGEQNQQLRSAFTNISNDLAYSKMKGKNSLGLYSHVSLYRNPQDLSIQPAVYAAGFNLPENLSMLRQETVIPTFYTNNFASVFLPDLISQEYKLGISGQAQELKSELTGTLPDSRIIMADNAVNNLSWRQHRIYADAIYNYNSKSRKLQIGFSAPLALQKTQFSNSPFTGKQKNTRLIFNPGLTAKFNHDQNEFSLALQHSTEPATIENSYPGYILKSYRSLYAQNHLYRSGMQMARVGYRLKRPVRLFFVNINAAYIRQKQNTILNSELSRDFSVINSVLFNGNESNTFMTSIGMSKYLFGLRSAVSGNYSWQYRRSNNLFNRILLPYNNYSSAITVKIDTRISNTIFFKYSGRHSWLSARQAGSKSAPAQSFSRLNQQSELSWAPAGFLNIRVGIEHLYNPNKDLNQVNNLFVDSYLQWKIAKYRLDLDLSVLNLANTTIYNITNLYANSIFTASYPLRRRMGLIKAAFTL